MWQVCSPSKCIPSSVFPNSLWIESLWRFVIYTPPNQAWPLISGESFQCKIMDWIETFTQDRKVRFWENCEAVLCLKLLCSFANHQHSVVSQHWSSHNWLTQSGAFFGARRLLENSQWVRRVLLVTSRKQRMQSLKSFCWKCDCFNKI